MGIKVLSVQNMVSWSCFHLMKNALPPDPASDNTNIKLILSDGVVRIYHRPIYVSEVLLEFPKHSVCRSDSFYIGQKIPPLSDQDLLQLGHKYFLLPTPFFHSVLSFVTIASFFSSSNSNNKNRFINNAAACHCPFDLQRTPSGCLRIRVSDEFISQLLEQGNNPKPLPPQQTPSLPLGKICTTPQLAKDYTQLVRTRRWKPKLETIKETQKKRVSSFGLKKAIPFQSTPIRSAYPLPHLRSIHFAYKHKIRIKSRS
ncbi:DUF4228 domain-containing protein [Cucumis melo var. makuwa]|uniref:Uncharacterized protein LOC103502830 n=3 Tax=Cucumis melo TaxID=3656 RepID=A0A1S3CNA0_CUCME|nr:uncharacterized protein LOC103502830 [Cucumis melo]TYK10680.1 DUF4228 domain-containing protein [Cucumis melo var. makuwa]